MFKHYQRRSNSIIPVTNNKDNLLSLEEILSKQRRHIDGKVFILVPTKVSDQGSDLRKNDTETYSRQEFRKSSGFEMEPEKYTYIQLKFIEFLQNDKEMVMLQFLDCTNQILFDQTKQMNELTDM